MLWANSLGLEVVLWAACATFIVCYSSLFERLRDNSEFFECPLCVGFWAGLLSHVASAPEFDRLALLGHFSVACVTSVVAFCLYRLLSSGE